MRVRLAWLFTVAALTAPSHAADVPASASASMTPLSLTVIGRNTFMLRDPLTLTFRDGAPSITVPAGFVTELGSIPKNLRWWDGKTDPSMAPAVLHDFLYWYQPCSQDEADAVMYHAMGVLGATHPKASSAFQAVNNAGSTAFKKNGERLRSGEVRTFTAAYSEVVVQSPNFDVSETLESALRKAQSGAGLVQREFASPAVKLTCARLLYQCKACVDHVTRKKTPKTRVAKGT